MSTQPGVCGQYPPPPGPARSWAYRLADSRAGANPEHIRLSHHIIDLLYVQPGLLRQLADEAESTL